MNTKILFVLATAMVVPFNVLAKDTHPGDHVAVSDEVIAHQRANLEKNTVGKGFGPQAPRDIDSVAGSNTVSFSPAPAHTEMNLCNIHFHKNAEHKGGEFTKYSGNGDGQGYNSGFKYSGALSREEMVHLDHEVCPSEHGGLQSGDTIEVHYVHSTAQVKPGPTLGACLNDAIMNPQLRVETQVYVLVNDSGALDFKKLTVHGKRNGFQQALGIPNNTGKPVQYSGSTTGPSYNEQGSPFQVTWSVRPNVAKVNIASVGEWCKGNVFNEVHGHGVRNLVKNPKLISEIDQ
ncbi:MAG TPA: delta-class carbonic anhydrase [Cellvibrionaceae bacterium]